MKKTGSMLSYLVRPPPPKSDDDGKKRAHQDDQDAEGMMAPAPVVHLGSGGESSSSSEQASSAPPPPTAAAAAASAATAAVGAPPLTTLSLGLKRQRQEKTTEPWEYHPGIYSKSESKAIFDQLHPYLLTKTPQKITVWNKEHVEGRLTAFFSEDGHAFQYSGGPERPSDGWPDFIQRLVQKAEELSGEVGAFDSALAHLYRDGNDKTGMHTDKDAMDGYVVSFSFGATRTFRIKHNDKGSKMISLDLEAGSVLVMKPGMQEEYKHEICSTKKMVGPRINVTMRQHRHLKRGKGNVVANGRKG